MKTRVALTLALMLVLGFAGMFSSVSAADQSVARASSACPCPAPACRYISSVQQCICDTQLCPCVTSPGGCDPE